jgi:uncharacterized DUF497 family protein
MGSVVYKSVYFEWDEQKYAANPGKHGGVTFDEALDVFFDPGLRIVDASRNDEVRDGIIGYGARSRLLFVVTIEILDRGFRIISARKAEPAERRLYEDE